MKKSLARIAKLALIVCLLNGAAVADFREHFDLGQNYLANYQYSGAITEFRSALRINYLDNSARIGLVNSYLARGTYYANSQNDYDRAANDFRSALFYLKYYPDDKEVNDSATAIAVVKQNYHKSVTIEVLYLEKMVICLLAVMNLCKLLKVQIKTCKKRLTQM